MRKQILGIVLVGVLVILAGCANTPTGEVTKLTFNERCAKDGNMWMTMGPTLDGVPTGEPACAGCMVGGNHYCSEQEYLKAK